MESLSLRLLYGTWAGRGILKLLIRPGPSRLAGRYLDSRHSKWLIAPFIRRNELDMAEYAREDYASFNAFFARHKRPECLRPDMDPDHLISPCDGFLSACEIGADSRFKIKGIEYRLAGLLADAALAERFQGGYCFIFRLTPQNFHRYCYIDGGAREREAVIPGVLHCVRPIACERYPVYAQNSREYVLLRTENFGSVVQMEIGALLVGRICNHPGGERVLRGEEKGYFEFGGSTIVLVFEKGRVVPDAGIEDGTLRGLERPVRAGERVGLRAT